MKKFSIFAAIAALATVSINSANYITLGDDVRIPPRYSDGYFKVQADMHIDGMCDDWSINTTFPEGITPKLVSGITPLEGMTVSYTDHAGAFQQYEAPLQVSAGYGTISSHVSVTGYWDYNEDGYWEPYGSAKWMPGDHDLFLLNLYVGPDFEDGYIIFDGTLTSGSDQRGAVLQGVKFYKKTHVWVGYMPGDMNGDDRLTIADVTMMINYLLNSDGFDRWQVKAADFTLDGERNISDVSRLINHLLKK